MGYRSRIGCRTRRSFVPRRGGNRMGSRLIVLGFIAVLAAGCATAPWVTSSPEADSTGGEATSRELQQLQERVHALKRFLEHVSGRLRTDITHLVALTAADAKNALARIDDLKTKG